jgi:hypothetical protein
MKNHKLILCFVCFCHLFVVCADTSLPWFNSCSTNLEKNTWELNGAAQEMSGTLVTTANGDWCKNKLSFSQPQILMEWMIQLDESQGAFEVMLGGDLNQVIWRLSKEKNPLGAPIWKSGIEISASIKEISPREKVIENVATGKWLSFSVVKRVKTCEIWLEGKLLESFKWAPEAIQIVFRASGDLIVKCDEFFIDALALELGRLDDSTLEKNGKMPTGWTQRKGVWSTIWMPRSDRLALCQSMETYGWLSFAESLTEGSTYTAEVRFDGKGQVGIGIFDASGEAGCRVMIRQHVSYGIVGENCEQGRYNMLFRNGVTVFPGVWYTLSMSCRGGMVYVKLNGADVGVFESQNYGYPALLSDGALGAFYRNIKIGEVRLGKEILVPLQLSQGTVKSESVQEDIVNIFIPEKATNFAEQQITVPELNWSANWLWKPKSSQSSWLKIGHPQQSLEFCMALYEKQWEVALFVEGQWETPELVLPMGLEKIFMHGRTKKTKCVFRSALTEGPSGKGFNFQVIGSLDRSKRYLTISIDGRRMGIWPFEKAANTTFSIGSQGMSEISKFSMETNNAQNIFGLELFKSSLGSMEKVGESFNDRFMGSGNLISLSPLLVEDSSLTWLMGPREEGGIVALKLLDSKGVLKFSSEVNFKSLAPITWSVSSPGKVEPMFKNTSNRWQLGIKRLRSELLLTIDQQELGRVKIPIGAEPWFLECQSEGDFVVENQWYGWMDAFATNLFDMHRIKSSTKFWNYSDLEDKNPHKERNKAGSRFIGTMTLKQNLGARHQVWLVSRGNTTDSMARLHTVEWRSGENNIRLMVQLLEGGCDVQWFYNDKVCGQKRLRTQAFQVFANFDEKNKLTMWLAGEQLGEVVDIGNSDWKLSLKPAAATSEQCWQWVMWRNR